MSNKNFKSCRLYDDSNHGNFISSIRLIYASVMEARRPHYCGRSFFTFKPLKDCLISKYRSISSIN